MREITAVREFCTPEAEQVSWTHWSLCFRSVCVAMFLCIMLRTWSQPPHNSHSSPSMHLSEPRCSTCRQVMAFIFKIPATQTNMINKIFTPLLTFVDIFRALWFVYRYTEDLSEHLMKVNKCGESLDQKNMFWKSFFFNKFCQYSRY